MKVVEESGVVSVKSKSVSGSVSVHSKSRTSMPAVVHEPSSSLETLVERQKESLLRTLKECRVAEEKRSARFERASSASERTTLEARFEMERTLDQERVQRLTTDFNLVRRAVVQGDINEAVVETRKVLATKKVLPKLEPDHNRFAGCDTQADLIKLEGAYRMFEKIDRQAALKRLPKFDPYPIQKNLALLRQKRDILQQLVSVQVRALNAQQLQGGGGMMQSLPAAHRPMQRADTASVYSDATSTSSKASWATFASSHTARGVASAGAPRRPLKVPPLQLSGR